MVPWIQVYSNLPEHPKIYKLMDLLGLKKNRDAVGMIVELWCWVVVNATDGDITRFPPKAIAGAMEWSGKPQRLYDALVDAQWLDRTKDGRVLVHDWEEYASLLIQSMDNQKKKTRERVKRYRDHKKQECNVTGNVYGNATVTECNASTVPNLTRPDHILTTTTTRTSAVTYFLDKVNGKASETAQREIAAFEADMSADVCTLAMDMALDAGKTSWSYVRAILENWRRIGIQSVADVERHEISRKGAKREAQFIPADDPYNGLSKEDFERNIERIRRMNEEYRSMSEKGGTGC